MNGLLGKFPNKYIPLNVVDHNDYMSLGRTDFLTRPAHDQIELYSGLLGTPRTFSGNHELGHVLENRNNGVGVRKDLWMDLVPQEKLGAVQSGVKNYLDSIKERIVEKYPGTIESGYLRNPKSFTTKELLLELQAIEDTYNVDLFKDPLFAPLFGDKTIRDMYSAMSGYRRTRMDARDLPPYTVTNGGLLGK